MAYPATQKPTAFLFRHLLGAVLLCALGTVQNESEAARFIPRTENRVEPPSLALPDLDGRITTLAQFEGKVVAINFWATWCAPCREELPSMESTYQAFKDSGFVIVAVNIGEDWDAITDYLETIEINFPVLLDQDIELASAFKAVGLPTTYFVDRHGRISHLIKGGRDWNNPEFRAELRAILDE